MIQPRHVLLNALFLAPAISGGPETYLRGLAPALAREAPGLALTIVTTASGARALRRDGFEEFARVVATPCEDGQRLRRQLVEQTLLPALARRHRAQLVHSLANLAPLAPLTRAVVTIHDVTFLRERVFGAASTLGMGMLVRAAAHRADALITGSAAARDDICALLQVDPGRFTVVHHGRERPRRAPASAPAELRARLRVGERRVVLCLAAKRPHKNQEVLVRAAQTLPADVVILLVGHAEPYERTLRELISQLGVAERVRLIDYVSDADLEGLWGIAACAAQPTLSEGFGLPVLEALDHGVPVACSDLAVLREVAGDLAHYFAPRDPAAAARAIEAAMADTSIRARGPGHAGSFTWARAARETHGVYERVLCTSA